MNPLPLRLLHGTCAVLSLFLASTLCAAEATTLSVGELLRSGDSHVGQTVHVEGFVVEVCHSGGRKAFLHDSRPEVKGNLRIERTGSMRAFDQELKGRTLEVTGVVRELRIDKAYLDDWEARARAKAEQEKEGEHKKQCDGGDCNDSLALQAALKRINAYRGMVAKSEKGYLSSIWMDGSEWSVKPATE